jgi:hypothetical protein
MQVLMFIAFEGWRDRVGKRWETEQGVARMHEELEQREREQWFSQQAGYCGTCAQARPPVANSTVCLESRCQKRQ